MEILASWLQAIGSVGAIIVAVWLWRRDKQRRQDEILREAKERQQRLIAGLRAEIYEAVTAAGIRQHATDRLFEQLQQIVQTAKDGTAQIGTAPVAADSMNITDGIVYRAVASELGHLPAGFVSDIVRFYALTQEFNRMTKVGTPAVSTYQSIRPLLPRIRMRGGMPISLLDKFAAANFDSSANLRLTQEELSAMAKQFDYPLEEIIKDRNRFQNIVA